MVRVLEKFINKRLFISGLIVIFLGFFISVYPTMVVNNLYRRYESVSLIDDENRRKQIQQELIYHLTYFEKLRATINPIGTLVVVLGVLLLVLALVWKFLG